METTSYNRQTVVEENHAELSVTQHSVSSFKTPSRVVVLVNGRSLVFNRIGSPGFVNVHNVSLGTVPSRLDHITYVSADLAEGISPAEATQVAKRICSSAAALGLHPVTGKLGWAELPRVPSRLNLLDFAQARAALATHQATAIHLCEGTDGKSRFWVDVRKGTADQTAYSVTVKLMQNISKAAQRKTETK